MKIKFEMTTAAGRSAAYALPFSIGVLSDLSAGRNDVTLRDRRFREVNPESFDYVADFHVIISGNLEATFKSFANLAHIFLKAAEGIQARGPLGRRSVGRAEPRGVWGLPGRRV